MGLPTGPSWAAHKSVGMFAWLWFVFRSTIIMLVVDNPLSWKFGFRGAVNKFDDIEGTCPAMHRMTKHKLTSAAHKGPYFLQGAPIRQVGEGKAVLASKDFLSSESRIALNGGRVGY